MFIHKVSQRKEAEKAVSATQTETLTDLIDAVRHVKGQAALPRLRAAFRSETVATDMVAVRSAASTAGPVQ